MPPNPRRGTSRKGGRRCEPHGRLVGAVGAVGTMGGVGMVGVVGMMGVVGGVGVMGGVGAVVAFDVK